MTINEERPGPWLESLQNISFFRGLHVCSVIDNFVESVIDNFVGCNIIDNFVCAN